MFLSLALGFTLVALAFWSTAEGYSSPAGLLKLPLLVASITLSGLWWCRRRPGETITAASVVGALLVMVLLLVGFALIHSLTGRARVPPPLAAFFIGVILLLGLAVLGLKHYRASFDLAASAMVREGNLPRELRHSNRGFFIGVGLVLLMLAGLRLMERDAADRETGRLTMFYQLAESLIGPSGPAVLLAALVVTLILYGWLVRQ